MFLTRSLFRLLPVTLLLQVALAGCARRSAAVPMPRLQSIFAAEGVPPELAWMAEIESSLKADAEGDYGARGSFQLTPGTARSLGLRIFLPDDRLDPELSARAVARRLRALGE